MPKRTPLSGKGRTLIWDVETDGLLHQVTKAHCIVAIDDETGEEFAFHDEPLYTPRSGTLAEGRRFIQEAAKLIGHNIVDYDLRVMGLLFPDDWNPPQKPGEPSVYDTLVAARLLRPDMFDLDRMFVAKGKLEPQLMKSHGLKAWGQRLGEHKGDPGGGWDIFTQTMLDYAMQDCRVNRKLWRFLQKKDLSPVALYHEHRVADIVAREETNGFGFDHAGAVDLQAKLTDELHAATERLRTVFKPWYMGRKPVIPKATRNVKMTGLPPIRVRRVSEKTGKPLKDYVGPPFSTYTEGAAYTPIKLTEFSPTSRDHVASRLIAVYGWKPTQLTPDGSVKLDETILASLPRTIPEHVRDDLLLVFALGKILGQLSQGAQSWLRNYNPETQAIHGRVNPNGAVTGRGTHMKPNKAQVPKVLKNAKKEILLGYEGGWGFESRSLFVPRRRHLGWKMTGCDQSALELVTMAHYLEPYDGGDYISRLSQPGFDPHSYHLSLFDGLISTRDQAKTIIYAFLYGAGLWLLGHHLDPTASDQKKIALGKEFRKRLRKNFPGLEDLYTTVQAQVKRRGYLKGLDGRHIYIRAQHSAFNFLLQSAGAVVCKRWLIELEDQLIGKGLLPGINWAQMAWVHDEVQIEHEPHLGLIIGKTAAHAAVRAGELVGLKCPTSGEYKTGNNWAETH